MGSRSITTETEVPELVERRGQTPKAKAKRAGISLAMFLSGFAGGAAVTAPTKPCGDCQVQTAKHKPARPEPVKP